MRRQAIAACQRQQGRSRECLRIVTLRASGTMPRLEDIDAFRDDRSTDPGLDIQGQGVAQLIEQANLELTQDRFQVFPRDQARQCRMVEGKQWIVRVVATEQPHQ
jgi:hypothetical protein